MNKRCRAPKSSRQRGFTLTELMVVIGIFAILATIAIPSYTAYIKNAKYSQAESSLVLLSTLMERYYQNNNAYPASTTTGLLPNAIPGWDPGNSPNPLFTYNITTPDAAGMPAACNAPAIPAPSYLLTATATATSGLPSGATGDVFYLDSANNRCEDLAGSVVVGW